MDDSEWRDGRSDDQMVWSRRILVRASNSGWRDGFIGDIKLEQVVVWKDNGEKAVITDPESSIHKIDLEHFSPSGESTRLSIQHQTSYDGQIIPGRSDELMGILPFILQQSEVGETMRHGESGRFTFVFTLEDNKRIYSVPIDVTTDLTDSAGGDLAG